MGRNSARLFAAQEAAKYIRDRAGHMLYTSIAGMIVPKLKACVMLGTGWSEALMERVEDTVCIPLIEIPGFEALKNMEGIEGHHRELVFGKLKDKTLETVAMFRGRLHMNEMHDSEMLSRMVRLQLEMMMELGVKNFILTNAAGSLRPRGFIDWMSSLGKAKIRTGDIIAYNAFVLPQMFAPPLWAGEFVSPEDVLRLINILRIKNAAKEAGLVYHEGALAYVRGPCFEGRAHDKRNLRKKGASAVGMSIAPECSVLALDSSIRVLALGFISNDDLEVHSDDLNKARAKESSEKLGNLLLNLIASI